MKTKTKKIVKAKQGTKESREIQTFLLLNGLKNETDIPEHLIEPLKMFIDVSFP